MNKRFTCGSDPQAKVVNRGCHGVEFATELKKQVDKALEVTKAKNT